MTKPTVQAVLIDDDLLVRAGWELRAREAGVALVCFASTGEARKTLSGWAKDTRIFVDSSLAGGEKGEVFAREMTDAGFTEVYLVTGYPPSHFPEMPWLKGILGKLPPEWLFGSVG